jgi:hypothetical protein
MGDRPPQWGEPGYVPPPPQPPRAPVQLRPWQRRMLWFALVLAALGQVAYRVGFNWGGTVCDGAPLFIHPVLGWAGLLGSVAALALAALAVRSWWTLVSSTLAAMTLLIALGLGLEILIPWGAACW